LSKGLSHHVRKVILLPCNANLRVTSGNPRLRQLTFDKPPTIMFRKLRELYNEYRAYVRVDLVMYAVMLLLIVIYIVFELL
jgi:hypothetical protein